MMSSARRYEDLSTLLLLVPFIASGGYAIFLWATSGFTPILPTSVYLNVTRDPYVFLAGTFAVLVGLLLDLAGSDPGARRERLAGASGYLQKTAAACFVLSLLMAWYANGFVDISGTAQDFIIGRYSTAFPAMLVLLSYLVNPGLKFSVSAGSKVVGFLVMLAVPAVVYEVGKRNAVVGLSGAAALLVIGAYLLVRSPAKTADAD